MAIGMCPSHIFAFGLARGDSNVKSWMHRPQFRIDRVIDALFCSRALPAASFPFRNGFVKFVQSKLYGT